MRQKGKQIGPSALITRVTSRAKGSGKRAEDFKRGGALDYERRSAQTYRSGIQRALLEARHRVPVSGYESFFTDLSRLAVVEERRFSVVPVSYDFMATMESPQAIPLQSELAWLSYRIAHYSDVVQAFLVDKRNIQKHVLAGDMKGALQALLDHENRAGVSLWSMSLQIALRQASAGLADQKSYVTTIKQLFRGGLLPFLASFISQRAEESVSIGWYIENTTRRIARAKKTDIMRYVAYKALSQWPDRADQFATILRMEQNHHEIDVFETTVSALQQLVARHQSAIPAEFLRSVVGRLMHVPDHRIEKLAVALDLVSPPEAIDDDAGLSALVEGRLRECYTAARKAQRSRGSVLGTAVVALVLSEHPIKPMQTGGQRNGILRWVAEGLSKAFSKMSDLEGHSGEGAVRKFAYVFEALDVAQAIRFLAESQLGRGHKAFCESLRLCSFSAEEFSAIDVVGSSREEPIAKRLVTKIASGASAEFAALHVCPDASVRSSIEPDVASIARSCGLLARGKVDLVGIEIKSAIASRFRAVSSNAAVFALDAFATTGDVSEAAELLAREVAIKDTDPELLPISPIFANSEWRDLRGVAGEIDLSIALCLYAKISGDRRAHTYRCFALETFLSSHGLSKPSELRSKLSEMDADKLVFFLWKACEPSVLDMLPALDSSRAVLEERRDLCALLLQMYPGVPAFEQELLSISSELTIRRGLQTLDGSRVHVDHASLAAILVREIAESYQRYGALVRSGAVVSETFSAVIRELLKSDINPKYLLAVPESEADELLIAIFLHVRNRFLFDPHHGLDSYLSKRIRHGSIVGYIRSPAEKEGIVTQQNADGTYRANTTWRKHFDSSHRRSDLERAFVSFAKALDQNLVRVKDVLLHVRSELKPLGVFDVHLTPSMYHLLRSAAAGDPPIEAFVRGVLSLLDGGLNPSLQTARELLERDTSKFVSEQFDTLRASVMSIMGATPERAELIAGINRASTNVHGAIASVATWFDPISQEDVAYTMREVVDIAIASVGATVPGFSPNIHFNDRTGTKFRNLLMLLDVLFVVFGNIAHWSNKDGKPDVWVDALMEDGVLTLRVENDVVLTKSVEDSKSALDDRLAMLRSGGGAEMVQKEGGSGLFKLATNAFDLSSDGLDCGYRSDDRFYLLIRLQAG